MTVNPLMIVKLKDSVHSFRKRHPGFSSFVSALQKKGIPEGSVMDISMTFPDGRKMSTNFKATQEDIELLGMIAELKP